MSIDYDIGCTKCKECMHIGQRFSSGWEFGYGRSDVAGRLAIGEFIQKHACCGIGSLQVRISDALDETYVFVCGEYRCVDKAMNGAK